MTATISVAQHPYQPIEKDPITEPWRWRVFDELIGLGLRSITEDRAGNMWFGTDNGIHRYDGLRWTEYRTSDSLRGVTVDVLFGASDGSVYAGTQYGIRRYQDGVWNSVFPKEEGVPWHIDSIKEAEDGSIWAATAWGALHMGRSDTTVYLSRDMEEALLLVAPYMHYVLVPDHAVPARTWAAGLGFKIAQGAWFGLPRENAPVVVWAIAPNGPAEEAGLRVGDQIIAVDGQFAMSRNRIKRPSSVPVVLSVKREGLEEAFEITLTHADLDGVVRDFHVSDLLEAQDGKIWFVSYEGEVIRYDPAAGSPREAWKMFDESHGLDLGWSPRMIQTRSGDIWTVSGGSGAVNRFDGTRWTQFRMSDLGSTNDNTSILQTQDGTIWVGGTTLHAYRNGNWSVYDNLEGTIPAPRNQLFEASDGALWVIGVGQIATRLDYLNSKWTTYEDLLFEHEAENGTRWFVASEGYVVRNIDENWVRFGAREGMMDTPNPVHVTREGDVWAAGGHNGHAATARFDGNRWSIQTHPDFPRSIVHHAVFESTDGSLWFGAGSGGPRGSILRMKISEGTGDPTWLYYPHPEGPPFVFGIGEGPDGVIWSGGHQLYRFEAEKWTPISQPEALSSFVLDIDRTENDVLWIGTRYYGAFSFDGRTWRQHSVQTGLAADRVEAILAGRDGTVWAATPKGISRFDGESWTKYAHPSFKTADIARGGLSIAPDGALWINAGTPQNPRWSATRYAPDTNPPETELTVFRDRVSSDGNTVIAWHGFDVWNDTPKEELQYAYRMDGGAWRGYTRETRRAYFSLRSGDHTFEVRARDRDFNVDPTPAILHLTVLPSVWRQAWFLGLMLVLAAVIGVQAARVLYKNRKLKESNLILQETNEELNTSNIKLGERTSELKERTSQLAYRSAFENLISTISSKLMVLRPESIDTFIEDAMEDIGTFVKVESAYIFRLSEDGESFTRSHFWATDALHSRFADLTVFRTDAIPWLSKRILNREVVAVESTSELPDEALRDKKLLKGLGVRSTVDIPILYQDRVIGFLGFASTKDGRRWSQDEIRLLELSSQIFQNALDQKESEMHLEMAKKHTEAILENLVDGVITSNDQGLIQSFSPAAERIFRYKSEDVIGQHVTILFPAEEAKRYKQFINRYMETGEERLFGNTHETIGRREDKVEFPLYFATSMFEHEGERIFTGVVRDISAHKKAEGELRRLKDRAETAQAEMEDQLRQALKMEAIGQLAGGVAHDFNNILQVMQMNAEILLDRLDEKSDDYEFVSAIARASDRAAALTRQLLLFSRRDVVKMKDVVLEDVVENLLKMIGRTIGEHIKLEFRKAGEGAVIHADESQLEQVVMNLCVNARDAMPDGGLLIIETNRATIDESFCDMHFWARPGSYAIISVSDTGHGMDEITQRQIFEPFFTTKELGKGTGLGLSTVFGIVTHHHGLIHVRSALDKGTTFRIYFPLLQVEVIEANEIREDKAPRGSETILMAEDDKMVCDLCVRILQEGGYHVLVASDGEEAISLIDENFKELDMVLLDVIMPKKSGKAVYERFKELKPDGRVLFMSGYSTGVMESDYLSVRKISFIQKPFNSSALLRAVRAVLDLES